MQDKSNIGNLFDSIALTYDRFNHVLSLDSDKRWRRRAVSRMTHSDSVLDVAAGTGDLSIELVRQNKAGTVTGMDISLKMMEIGREKVSAKGLEDRIIFQEGSALDMPFEDNSFNAVTCAYGVRNFSDLDKGLSEMFRVLKDGGQLMILEFSYPENRFIRFFYDIYFSRIMPLVGKALSRNKCAYLYFRDSVKGFIWGEKMKEKIEAAGFINVKYRVMTFGITTVYYASKD